MALAADVLSFICKESFENVDDVSSFVDQHPEEFMGLVEREAAFVAPNGKIGLPLEESLDDYLAYIGKWRSSSQVEAYSYLAPAKLLLVGLLERLGPMYHALENADELHAHPTFCTEQTAHYFDLVSRPCNERISRMGLVDKRTTAVLGALRQRRLAWLAGIPLEDVARLKADGAVSEFRVRLGHAAERLSESRLENIERVASEVATELNTLITEYKSTEQRLIEEMSRRHSTTLVGASAGLALSFLPVLAPFLGTIVPLGTVGKYAVDKIHEHYERRTISRSLMGVIARAHKR